VVDALITSRDIQRSDRLACSTPWCLHESFFLVHRDGTVTSFSCTWVSIIVVRLAVHALFLFGQKSRRSESAGSLSFACGRIVIRYAHHLVFATSFSSRHACFGLRLSSGDSLACSFDFETAACVQQHVCASPCCMLHIIRARHAFLRPEA
jgi:hypothetical protein